MKKILALLFVFVFLLSSCVHYNPPGDEEHSLGGVPSRLTPSADKIAVFADGAPQGFWARNDRGNGPPFNCSFMRSNAVINDGLLTLSLTNSSNGYVGAEYRSREKFGFGYYSVSMKAAKCPGVISSFFT